MESKLRGPTYTESESVGIHQLLPVRGMDCQLYNRQRFDFVFRLALPCTRLETGRRKAPHHTPNPLIRFVDTVIINPLSERSNRNEAKPISASGAFRSPIPSICCAQSHRIG